LCLGYNLPAHADTLSSSCITGAVVLPLLGGRGDAPIIPVEVNGHPAALYVTPGFAHMFIHNAGSLWFPLGPEQVMRAQDGNLSYVRDTQINSLKLGQIELTMLPAELLSGDAQHKVGDRPIIGLLGHDYLKSVELLVDMPHRKLAIFKWSKKAACGTDLSTLFDGNVTTLRMDSDAGVDVGVGSALPRMSLDPDLEESVLPLSMARTLGATDEALASDEKVTTKYVSRVMGRDHKFTQVRFGNYTLPSFNFLVQDRILQGAIGQNFFENVVALFDFPHGRFLFQSTEDRDDTPPLHLHFDAAREGHAAVHETHGRPSP